MEGYPLSAIRWPNPAAAASLCRDEQRIQRIRRMYIYVRFCFYRWLRVYIDVQICRWLYPPILYKSRMTCIERMDL